MTLADDIRDLEDEAAGWEARAATYGTAIRKRKSKRILDVDLSYDREEAERLVAQQNAKDVIQALRVEWIVVEIRALESDHTDGSK